jgi:HIV Tat-specific factor 1
VGRKMSGQRDLSDFEYQLQAERLTADAGAAGAAGGWDKTQTYTDPSDGTVYEWDAEKKGWFPKIDDYFLAAYQANYGLAQPETTPTDPAPSAPAVQPVAGTQHPAGGENPTPDEQSSASSEDGARKRKQEPEEGWFEIEESKNHNIYVSGLPHDVTPEEFEQLMSKYGIVMEDDDGEPKLKLYRDASGEVKGDGRCCYLKIESVGLALQLLDGMQLRGSTIRAEKAKFSLKGSYNPALKKKPVKKSKKSKQSAQEKLLDWRERKAKAATNEHKTKYDKIVIVSHAFHPSEFEVRFNPFLTLSFDLLDTNFNFFPVLTFGHQFQVVDPLSTLFTVFPVLTLWAPNSSNLTPYPL